MRNCGIWVSPWVDQNTEVILDTSALSADDWLGALHHDPNPMPQDTVLVVIHPVRQRWLAEHVAPTIVQSFLQFGDANGRVLARHLIEERCRQDPKLRRKLRWS
jgi:hypothetical protein